MIIALFVLVWFLVGLAGACGRAYALGYLTAKNTPILQDIVVVLIGPLGALVGLSNAFAAMGSDRRTRTKLLVKQDN